MTKGEDETEFDLGAYTEDVADTLRLALKSKKFRAAYPKVHKALRERLRMLNEDLDKSDAEDESPRKGHDLEPHMTAESAGLLFRANSAKVLGDVKKRFNMR